jgi:hypothetical protein
MKYIRIFQFILFTVCIIMISIPRREGFISKGIQINSTFDVKGTINTLVKNKVKHIVIVPYFIGMHKLNFFVEKVNQMNDLTEDVYIFVIDNLEIATEFFSQISSTELSTPTIIVLTKNPTEGKELYIESQNMLLQHRLNKLLQKINKG